LEELLRGPGALGDQVTAVRAALAAASGQQPDDVELRVAASMTQLGLAGRLICPALGVAVLCGGLLEVNPTRMRWQPGPGGAVALSVDTDTVTAATGTAAAIGSLAAAGTAADPVALADALAATVLAGPVRALVEVSRQFAVSPQVLWGNVASVVNGARGLIGAAEPELLGRAEAIVARLLDQPPLGATHQGSSSATGFRRRSCCLVYRLVAAQAPVCGDCVLDRAPLATSRRPVS
jgi:hypothetical protein